MIVTRMLILIERTTKFLLNFGKLHGQFLTTSSPGRFSLALGAGREKALASAGRSVILIG